MTSNIYNRPPSYKVLLFTQHYFMKVYSGTLEECKENEESLLKQTRKIQMRGAENLRPGEHNFVRIEVEHDNPIPHNEYLSIRPEEIRSIRIVPQGISPEMPGDEDDDDDDEEHTPFTPNFLSEDLGGDLE